VFQEWYWAPLFLLIIYGPPLVLGAVLVDAVGTCLARRRGWKRSAALRVGVAGAISIVLVGTLGALSIW